MKQMFLYSFLFLRFSQVLLNFRDIGKTLGKF